MREENVSSNKGRGIRVAESKVRSAGIVGECADAALAGVWEEEEKGQDSKIPPSPLPLSGPHSNPCVRDRARYIAHSSSSWNTKALISILWRGITSCPTNASSVIPVCGVLAESSAFSQHLRRSAAD